MYIYIYNYYIYIYINIYIYISIYNIYIYQYIIYIYIYHISNRAPQSFYSPPRCKVVGPGWQRDPGEASRRQRCRDCSRSGRFWSPEAEDNKFGGIDIYIYIHTSIAIQQSIYIYLYSYISIYRDSYYLYIYISSLCISIASSTKAGR